MPTWNPHKRCPDCGNQMHYHRRNDAGFLTCTEQDELREESSVGVAFGSGAAILLIGVVVLIGRFLDWKPLPWP